MKSPERMAHLSKVSMELNKNVNCKRKNVNKKSDKQNNLHAAVTHTHRRIWMSYTCVSRFSVNTDM